jgi:hypothetical protein
MCSEELQPYDIQDPTVMWLSKFERSPYWYHQWQGIKSGVSPKLYDALTLSHKITR